VRRAAGDEVSGLEPPRTDAMVQSITWCSAGMHGGEAEKVTPFAARGGLSRVRALPRFCFTVGQFDERACEREDRDAVPLRGAEQLVERGSRRTSTKANKNALGRIEDAPGLRIKGVVGRNPVWLHVMSLLKRHAEGRIVTLSAALRGHRQRGALLARLAMICAPPSTGLHHERHWYQSVIASVRIRIHSIAVTKATERASRSHASRECRSSGG
jgi:hypothetical protein